MPSDKIPRNELCWLDGQLSVESSWAMTSTFLRSGSTAESRWLIWGRSGFAVLVVLVLIGLGLANIVMHTRWNEVEDGVLWAARSEGVVATEITAGSAGAALGIQRGDVLIAVNGSP